jgi:hypothetical protein
VSGKLPSCAFELFPNPLSPFFFPFPPFPLSLVPFHHPAISLRTLHPLEEEVLPEKPAPERVNGEIKGEERSGQLSREVEKTLSTISPPLKRDRDVVSYSYRCLWFLPVLPAVITYLFT